MAYVTPDNPPEGFACRGIFAPIGQAWQAILTGSLYALCLPTSFEQVSGITPEQAAAVFQVMFGLWDKGTCPMFPGMMAISAGNITPFAWLLCDGTAYEQTEYPALYAAIGTLYGSDGAGTFRVPDMRLKFPLGLSAGDGYDLGDTGGEITHTLTEAELAYHYHDMSYSNLSRNNPTTGTAWNAKQPGGEGVTVSGEGAGSGQAHNNMPPFLGLNFLIYAGV